MNRKTYKQPFLKAYEVTYKKDQLTLWLFLSLKDQPEYVSEIKEFIETNSNNTITYEKQSLYRTLRIYPELEMVEFDLAQSEWGLAGITILQRRGGEKCWTHFTLKFENIHQIFGIMGIWGVVLFFYFIFSLWSSKNAIKGIPKEDIFE